MDRFFRLLAALAICGLVTAQVKPASKPKLLTLEQQQELLEQLAQLQRQTQQLLAAQQSLAAVAAAAGVTTQANQAQSSSNALHSSPRSSTQSISISAPKPKSLSSSKPATSVASSSSSSHNSGSSAPQSPPLPSGPQINWGKCPELEPSEQEKLAKAGVITKCLETTPLPGNITRESVEQHREQIAACALRAEGWFTNAGGYDYGKAEKEIKNKRLQKDLELQVLSYHAQCKAESEEKYPQSNSSIIAQIQLYQACMDYFISDVCGIEVNEPEASQFN